MSDLFRIIKDVPGYPGYYVSTDGRVYSSRSGKFIERVQQTGYHGYKTVHLNKDGRCCPTRVHRLVAMAFLIRDETRDTVNHKDGIKHNNDVSNLEWVTQSENLKHSFRHLNRKRSSPGLGKFGALHPLSKPVYARRIADGKEFWYDCAASAARANGWSSAGICRAIKGVTPKYKDCHWRLA